MMLHPEDTNTHKRTPVLTDAGTVKGDTAIIKMQVLKNTMERGLREAGRASRRRRGLGGMRMAAEGAWE